MKWPVRSIIRIISRILTIRNKAGAVIRITGKAHRTIATKTCKDTVCLSGKGRDIIIPIPIVQCKCLVKIVYTIRVIRMDNIILKT